MTDAEHSAQLAAVPEGARDAFIDLLLEHWPRIASVAWDGWLAHGRGTVTIEDGIVPLVLAYRRGAPCPCCAGVVEAYDPETQAGVAGGRNAGGDCSAGTPRPGAAPPSPGAPAPGPGPGQCTAVCASMSPPSDRPRAAWSHPFAPDPRRT